MTPTDLEPDGQAPRLKPEWVGLALLIAVIAISLAAIFFRKAAPTHPLVAAGTRLLIATAVLSPFMFRRVMALPKKIKVAGMVGGLLYAVHFGAWVWSLNLTSVAASVTLVTATPIMLAVYGLFSRRDRPGKKLMFALILATLGVLCIGGHDLGHSSAAAAGDALALVGAIGMAGYMLLVRGLGSIDTLAFMNIAVACSAIILLGLATLLGIFPLPQSPQAWGWLALAALIPQIVGHGILTWSLRHTTPTRVGLITVGEPVGAAALAWFWLGDTLSPEVLVGCAMTCAAVFMALKESQNEDSSAQQS